MGEKCPHSARGFPALLEYLAVVVVQDACALLSSSDADTQAAARANVVHRHLLKNQAFRYVWCEPTPHLQQGSSRRAYWQ